MFQLKGVIKHYAWGGHEFLPKLLDLNHEEDRTYAEYWIGSHPDGDAQIKNLPSISLRTYIEKHPDKIFPKDYRGSKEGLPFLFKILDVKDMLSIQLHPDKETAEQGFASEEAAGKDRKAPDRVYKDDNHKPELMVALSDFWLVQGFKTPTEIQETLEAQPELYELVPVLKELGLPGLYRHIMTASQEKVNSWLKPLGKRIKPMYESGQLTRENIHFWAARAFMTFNRKGVCDRGILSLYLMNLVHLHPGEGIYQAPGILHAYMEGQNVECMANSDNVIRGGLTPKHMEVPLLLDLVDYQPNVPQIIRPTSESGWYTYPTPAREFTLSIYRRGGVQPLPKGKSSLVVCVEGQYELMTDSGVCSLEPGDCFFITKDEEASIITLGEGGVLFLAQVPD